MNINAKVNDYNYSLQRFVDYNGLTPQWFRPIDHVAFKAYNANDYNQLVDQFKAPSSQQISEIWQSDRRLAVVRLAAGHAINVSMAQNPIRWVELMEAKPDDHSGQDPRLDHAEVYTPSLGAIRRRLRRNNITFANQMNGSHSWVSLQIGGNEELKFTDIPLAGIVHKEITDGSARIIWQTEPSN